MRKLVHFWSNKDSGHIIVMACWNFSATRYNNYIHMKPVYETNWVIFKIVWCSIKVLLSLCPLEGSRPQHAVQLFQNLYYLSVYCIHRELIFPLPPLGGSQRWGNINAKMQCLLWKCHGKRRGRYNFCGGLPFWLFFSEYWKHYMECLQ